MKTLFTKLFKPLFTFSGKKYAELHPKEEKKGKEKTPKDEKPKQGKAKQEKQKQEKAKKTDSAEEDDGIPKEPKAKDPYAGLPKRYAWTNYIPFLLKLIVIFLLWSQDLLGVWDIWDLPLLAASS